MGHYHITYLSRRGGYSAREHAQYLTRTGPYAHQGADLVWVQAGNLPSWTRGATARDKAVDYFTAADRYSRVNAHLATHSVLSLPRQLELSQQVAVTQDIIAVTIPQQPYLAAIHDDGTHHNPHLHLSWSGKRHDGQARTRRQWFTTYDAAHPERAGAPVNRALVQRGGTFRAVRQTISDLVNVHLHHHGRAPGYWLGTLKDLAVERSPQRRARQQDWQPGTHPPTPKEERTFAVAAWVTRAAQLGLQAGMSLVEKVGVIARHFQAQLARGTPARTRTLTPERQALQQTPARARALTPQRQRMQQRPPRQAAVVVVQRPRARERQRDQGQGMGW